MNTFAQLGVSEKVVAALSARGINAPFPIQQSVIQDAIAGHDILGKSQTGSGKTLAFSIPLVEKISKQPGKISALVLTPTRELALQVSKELESIARAHNLPVAVAYGGAPMGKQIQQCRKARILVATPGRLEDLCNRGHVKLTGVSYLVLDEADQMLDMGFAPQVDKLVQRMGDKPRQTMLFSATLGGEMKKLVNKYMNDPKLHEISAGEHKVVHLFQSVTREGKLDKLKGVLEGERSRTLVFVRTKHGADKLATKLGSDAEAIHGNLRQRARERALERFASGHIATLVATDVAARGIHVSDVDRVVNFDIPADENSFTHRVGRTGRAGATGESITFVAPDERRAVRSMATKLGLGEAFTSVFGTETDRPRAAGRPHTNGRGKNSAKRPYRGKNNRRPSRTS